MKRLTTFLSLALISILTSVTALAVPSAALAKPIVAPGDPALKQAFQAEQKWSNTQQDAINKADKAASDVQRVIDAASAEGRDVSALQNALNAFNGALSSVKSEHQAAASLISAHNGFDGSGEVTDRQSARQTVLDIRTHLMQAHVTLIQAVHNLHKAVLDWRAATFG